jgi:hypothetical protein
MPLTPYHYEVRFGKKDPDCCELTVFRKQLIKLGDLGVSEVFCAEITQIALTFDNQCFNVHY